MPINNFGIDFTWRKTPPAFPSCLQAASATTKPQCKTFVDGVFFYRVSISCAEEEFGASVSKTVNAFKSDTLLQHLEPVIKALGIDINEVACEIDGHCLIEDISNKAGKIADYASTAVGGARARARAAAGGGRGAGATSNEIRAVLMRKVGGMIFCKRVDASDEVAVRNLFLAGVAHFEPWKFDDALRSAAGMETATMMRVLLDGVPIPYLHLTAERYKSCPFADTLVHTALGKGTCEDIILIILEKCGGDYLRRLCSLFNGPWCPLVTAAYLGFRKVVDVCVKEGCDISKCWENRTVLGWARLGRLECGDSSRHADYDATIQLLMAARVAVDLRRRQREEEEQAEEPADDRKKEHNQEKAFMKLESESQ